MGNCPSSRGQFTPNHDSSANGTTGGIVINTVEEKGPSEKLDDKIEMEPVQDGTDNVIGNTNGTINGTKVVDGSTNILSVQQVDLCIAENGELHVTSEFDAVQRGISLVVRRGQAFHLNLVLSRQYDQENDILCLVFIAKDARNPSLSQGTQVILPVSKLPDAVHHDEKWSIKEFTSEENKISIRVVPSLDAIIGKWNLEIDSRVKDEPDDSNSCYKVIEPIIILFNPWCERDAVYLAEEAHRQEYVSSDSGLIWRGSHSSIRSSIWNYAQYEENVLECCLYLLSNICCMPVHQKSDPVHIVRHISSALNCRNNVGVMTGDWSGKYKGGKNAQSLCGSQSILQKFYKTKKPLRNCQSWVFSGVFTTVCRALGIPSRPVTNFSSPHHAHSKQIIDYYVDSEGKPVSELNGDSVWSCHAWTEVWMTRPDLGIGYGGWQAVDATTHNEYDDGFRCGPASVAAIKKGEVNKPFDTQSLFAEVNAAKAYWKFVGPKQPLKYIRNSYEEIGHYISTKTVGKYELEDITSLYKCETKPDRNSTLQSLKGIGGDRCTRCCFNNDQEDINFELLLPSDVTVGEPFTVKLKAVNKNQDEQQYTLSVCLQVHSSSYTGQLVKLVKKDAIETTVEPGVGQEISMKLEYGEYEHSMTDQCNFVISAMARVKETGFDFCAVEHFQLRMPIINLQVDGEIVQNHPITVTASFTNPLPKSLKNASFMLEGSGFGPPLVVKCKGEIKKGADARVTCQIIPKRSGTKVIAAKFNSKELSDVDGYQRMFVKKATETPEKDINSHL